MQARGRIRRKTLAVVPALLGLLAAGPTSAQERGTLTCSGSEDACLARWAADGRYQEIIDQIETTEIGLGPSAKYFLGVAYFALAGRTGALSLRCLYTTRAANQLESFLFGRQTEFDEKRSYGPAEMSRYTYVAARLLDSARATEGCQESGESLETLRRFGHGALTGAVEDLFFSYGLPGKPGAPASIESARKYFTTEMSALTEVAQDFAATVSRIETNYGLYEVEIAAGNRDLTRIATSANKWGAGGGVKLPAMGAAQPAVLIEERRDPSSGLSTFRSTQAMLDFLQRIRALDAEYTTLTAGGGPIGEAEELIRTIVGSVVASDLKIFKDKQAATIALAQKQLRDAASMNNLVVAVRKTTSFGALGAEPPGTVATSLDVDWRAIEDEWKQRKPQCGDTPDKWYCR